MQVVDAKTKQCLHGFNPTSPLEGNELQTVVDGDSPFATTPAEEEILAEHRLQLMLYSLALEISERSKPDNLRREILPPAIQISASGRMIRMRDEDYKQARIDLISLVEWCGEIAAVDEGIKAPDRLPMDKLSTCEKCPFYRGQSSYAVLLVRSSAIMTKVPGKSSFPATWCISTSLNPASSIADFHSSIDSVVM